MRTEKKNNLWAQEETEKWRKPKKFSRRKRRSLEETCKVREKEIAKLQREEEKNNKRQHEPSQQQHDEFVLRRRQKLHKRKLLQTFNAHGVCDCVRLHNTFTSPVQSKKTTRECYERIAYACYGADAMVDALYPNKTIRTEFQYWNRFALSSVDTKFSFQPKRRR